MTTPLPRWTLTMADASDTLICIINPNQADSAFVNDQPITWTSRGGLGYATEGHGYQFAGIRPPKAPQTWSFSGIVLSQQQHDDLLEWSRRPETIYLRTDLGEVLTIKLMGIKFSRKAPTSPRQTLRHEYTMNALVYDYQPEEI